MKSKYLLFCVAALAFAAVSAGDFVANPQRAYNVTWKKHFQNGRDFWLLLAYNWYALKGVSQEKFVQDSGNYGNLFFDEKNKNRVLSLDALSAVDANGKKVSPAITFSVGKNDMVLYQERLTDGKRNTFCVLTGDLSDIRTRFQPLKAEMKLSSSRPVKHITLIHGFGNSGKIAEAKLLNARGKISNKGRTLSVTLDKPAEKVALELSSEFLVYNPWIVENKRVKKYPFILLPRNRWIYGKFWGLQKENIDQKKLSDIKKKYADTLLGIELGEWDANMVHTLNRPQSAMFGQLEKFFTLPADREMMLKNIKVLWDIHRDVYGSGIFGLSGQVNFQHYGADNGGTIIAQELTPEHNDTQFRVSYVFQIGAARQYNRPSMMYHANYVWNYTCMDGDRAPNKYFGVDFGSPPSLSLRNYYTAYYTGHNYISCENQPYGQAQKDKNGVYQLTGNGKALKDIYEWTRSEKGRRGELYAPILLLADRKHGFDAGLRLPYQRHWKDLMKLREGDLLLEYVMQAISPNFDVHPYMKKTHGKPNYNLRNSELGDIFALYIANPLLTPEVSIGQLEKYPVVFLINNITFTQTLADTLKQYVFNGGTLVLTSAQLYPFENDKEFINITKLAGTVKKDGLILNRFKTDKNTKVLMKTADGTPLVYKNTFGKGNILTITSPYMQRVNGSYEVPPQMKAILKNIQKEVLPIRVEGSCQFLFNVMPDGTWKVILINNDGVNKAPWETKEFFDPKCTRTVKLIAPANTRAVELRRNAPVKVSQENGKKVYTLTIPSAEIFVVDISGMSSTQASKVTRTAVKPVKGFVYRPYDPGKDFDGYKKSHYPRQNRKQNKAPEIIGKWTAESGYKSAVGGTDMVWRGKQKFDGKTLNFAEVSFSADFAMNEGSWTIWAKPLPFDEYPVNFKKRKRGGVVYGDRLHLEYDNGHWVLGGQEIPKWYYYQGPKATGDWDHLAVVWKNRIARFFVNGKEVIKPTGPFKLLNEFGYISYYKKFNYRIGLIVPSWTEPCCFAGELGDFTSYGRALSEKEIQALAKEKVR